MLPSRRGLRAFESLREHAESLQRERCGMSGFNKAVVVEALKQKLRKSRVVTVATRTT